MGAQQDGAPNPPGSSYPGEAKAPPPSDGACEPVSTGEWIWPSWGLSYSQEEKGITWPLVWVTATYEGPTQVHGCRTKQDGGQAQDPQAWHRNVHILS